MFYKNWKYVEGFFPVKVKVKLGYLEVTFALQG